MANTTLEEKVKGLPEKDSVVLQRYAMWNPQVIDLIQERTRCGLCSHCTPGMVLQKSSPEKPKKNPNPDELRKPEKVNPINPQKPKWDMLRYLHGECHCHPCGSLIPEALREREQSG
jgi:hypothetical protein